MERGNPLDYLPLKPVRGGFLRPFGCGWFIREFLLGNGPEGSPSIDPNTGACQADIFYYYKRALLRAIALDRATRQEERQARREKRPISPDGIEKPGSHPLQGQQLPLSLICRLFLKPPETGLGGIYRQGRALKSSR